MNDLPTVSIVIPTRDRHEDLTNLLKTILNQDFAPIEIVIVDDSSSASAEHIAKLFSSQFASINCRLMYVKGTGNGLPEARNLGVSLCEGDAILFLDDDTLLDPNVLITLVTFLNTNSFALGIEPKIIRSCYKIRTVPAEKLKNALLKALGVGYREKDKQSVRRSGSSVFPSELTKVISAQRLSGCCCCYRREVFREFSFDTNLKRWGFMEDLDFSYRVHKKWPQSLWVIPNSKIVHEPSDQARLPMKLRTYMETTYSFYVFFKDFFDGSVQNLVAFLWALMGNLVKTLCELTIERKPKHEWRTLIYLLMAYATAFKNLRSILIGRLDFFNKTLH